jgi:hypothetical protein
MNKTNSIGRQVENYNVRFSSFENYYLKGSVVAILITLSVLILSLLRGLIPLLIDGLIETKYIYFFISGIFLIYTSYSIVTINKTLIPIQLKLLLISNLFFYILWLVVDFSAEGDPFFFISLAIFPFLLVFFFFVPVNTFNKVIFFLIPIIVSAVIIDYLLINSDIFTGNITIYGSSGESTGFELREKLRYLILTENVAPSHHLNPFNRIDGSFNPTGTSYRSVGLTGDEHDTSCILVMLSSFLLGLNTGYTKYKIVLLPLIYLSLFFTAATTNILIAIIIAGIMIIYKLNKKFLIKLLILTFIGLFFGYTFLPSFMDFLTIPFMKISNKEIMGLMFSKQVESNFTDELLNILLGHTSNLQISQFGKITEFGVLRVLYNAGLFPFCSLVALWLFPLILFLKTDKYTKNRMLPYVAGFYGGLFTLVHYGSILRTSNIVLFYSFFGMSIRMYVLSRKHIHLSN